MTIKNNVKVKMDPKKDKHIGKNAIYFSQWMYNQTVPIPMNGLTDSLIQPNLASESKFQCAVPVCNLS